jgi:hypothetical protein
MAERKLLGANLSFEEKILLAQLTTAPGWQILVRIMAEACRDATESVVKLDPTAERYNEKLVAMQTMTRAIHKFSADVLDSVKVHQTNAVKEADEKQNPVAKGTRFQGFKPPTPVLVKGPQSDKK